MADQDPPVDDIFSGMKKKKKSSSKKTVDLDAFDVDAASPSAPSNDATSNSTATDQTSVPTPGDAAAVEADFADLKKKTKKKKSVRIDSDAEDAEEIEEQKPKSRKRIDKLGNEIDDEPVDNQISAEVTAVDSSGMDEFSDLKKKKKKSSKKAFDLEAFEKELKEKEDNGEAEEEEDDDEEGAAPKSILKKKATPAGSDDEMEEGGGEDVPVEGENPFGKDGEDEEEGVVSKAEQAANAKEWLGSDRDYTYTEVKPPFPSPSSQTLSHTITNSLESYDTYSSSVDSLDSCINLTLRCLEERARRSTRSHLLNCSGKVTSDPFLPTLPTFVNECTVNPNMSFNSCSQSWVRMVRSMVRRGW